jgi:hypothetical protein
VAAGSGVLFVGGAIVVVIFSGASCGIALELRPESGVGERIQCIGVHIASISSRETLSKAIMVFAGGRGSG